MEAPQGSSLGRFGGIVAGGIVAVAAGSVMATREPNTLTVGVLRQSGEGAVDMPALTPPSLLMPQLRLMWSGHLTTRSQESGWRREKSGKKEEERRQTL